MSGKVTGVVHVIEDTKTYGQKGFRKRLVVLEQENERFTNYIPLEFTHDGCDSVDELNVGDEVEIEYRLSGRKWQRDAKSEVKFFLNAEARSFKLLNQKGSPATGETAGGTGGVSSANDAFDDAASFDDEDIPF